MFFKINFTV